MVSGDRRCERREGYMITQHPNYIPRFPVNAPLAFPATHAVSQDTSQVHFPALPREAV